MWFEVESVQQGCGRLGCPLDSVSDFVKLECGHTVVLDHDESNASLVGSLRECERHAEAF